MKRTGLQRHKPWTVTPGQADRWQSTQRDARQRYAAKQKTRPVHTPTSVVDLVIARSLRAFEADPLEHPRGLCELCGQPATNTHTRRPNGMGGTGRPDTYRASNKIRVCGHGNVTRCHGRIETNRPWALERGLLVPQNQAPAMRAVELAYGRVLFDDYGGYQPADTDKGNVA